MDKPNESAEPFKGYKSAVEKLRGYIGKEIFFQDNSGMIAIGGNRSKLVDILTFEDTSMFDERCLPHSLLLNSGDSINLSNIHYVASNNSVSRYNAVDEKGNLHPDVLYGKPEVLSSSPSLVDFEHLPSTFLENQED